LEIIIINIFITFIYVKQSSPVKMYKLMTKQTTCERHLSKNVHYTKTKNYARKK